MIPVGRDIPTKILCDECIYWEDLEDACHDENLDHGECHKQSPQTSGLHPWPRTLACDFCFEGWEKE